MVGGSPGRGSDRAVGWGRGEASVALRRTIRAACRSRDCHGRKICTRGIRSRDICRRDIRSRGLSSRGIHSRGTTLVTTSLAVLRREGFLPRDGLDRRANRPRRDLVCRAGQFRAGSRVSLALPPSSALTDSLPSLTGPTPHASQRARPRLLLDRSVTRRLPKQTVQGAVRIHGHRSFRARTGRLRCGQRMARLAPPRKGWITTATSAAGWPVSEWLHSSSWCSSSWSRCSKLLFSTC